MTNKYWFSAIVEEALQIAQVDANKDDGCSMGCMKLSNLVYGISKVLDKHYLTKAEQTRKHD